MIALCTKTLAGLKPANAEAETVFNGLALGAEVSVEIKRPRNLQMHKKWWSLITLVFNNQEAYASKEMLVAAIKLALGHCEVFEMKDGRTGFIPKSISFAKMSQDEFYDFYERTLDLVATRFLPGVEKQDLRAQVEEFLHG